MRIGSLHLTGQWDLEGYAPFHMVQDFGVQPGIWRRQIQNVQLLHKALGFWHYLQRSLLIYGELMHKPSFFTARAASVRAASPCLCADHDLKLRL